MIPALSFVPPNEVSASFDQLVEHPDFPAEAHCQPVADPKFPYMKFIAYFVLITIYITSVYLLSKFHEYLNMDAVMLGVSIALLEVLFAISTTIIENNL